MKELLKKLKLIDYLQTELVIQKNDFVNKLRYHVDEGSIGIFSDTFDIFSSSKNEYKGKVSFNGFKIKRRRRFFDMNMNMAVATGTYSQKDDKLIISTEINGFHGMMIPFYIFCIIIYGIFIIGFLSADEIGENALGFAFIIIHAAFMMGLPYFIMRRSTKRLKHELEREFFYLTK
ncbi:hypothetical protein ACG2LH_12565 [Zhouia sp. PK063]|uniref:hypothetical protein n=1 Tax=Zhouia sp. PK063 TaxID=3373602 RepID=UPI00378DDE2E